jgi:small subunit ribosomal protein S17
MARKITGKVTSDVQDKTVVVTVTTSKTHPIYGKKYKVSKKFQAHDENNEARRGDTVVIAETRPISKTKRFVLDSVVERGHEAVEIKKSVVEQEIEAKLAEKEAKKAAEGEQEAK